MRIAAVSLLVAVVALAAAPARAEREDEAFRKGNQAYLEKRYTDAIAAYEQLDRQGVASADLYYNLGSAYFRSHQLGRAIWSYERAAALEPDDDDARFNLAQARKLAERRARDRVEGIDREPLWQRVVTALPTSVQTWLFLGFYGATFVVLFARRRASGAMRVALAAGAALLGAAALAGGALLAGRVALADTPFAIVLPDALEVKEGADTNYRTSFELHAGLKLRLLERDHDWVKIRLPNGLEGWVPDKDVGRL